MPRLPSADLSAAERTETGLLNGSESVKRLVAQSASLMRAREAFQAYQGLSDDKGTLHRDRQLFQSLTRLTDPKAIFTRCRELSKTTGFIDWVLRVKKLLFNHGLAIASIPEANLPELRRVIDDIWREKLICDAVVAAWSVADGEDLPVIQVLDCEGVKYENEFGEETLTLCFRPRPVSEAQKEKLSTRYYDALRDGKEIIWGEEDGEEFKVMTNEKLGGGLGRPSLFAIFEDLAIHGLLQKGDWNAGWTTKDVIRQIKKGHAITGGSQMSGMPVHFLKASERDAIHKAMKDKAGAFDIVTNFDVDVVYPAFDFKFFDDAKYAAVRQRLMEWAGPLGLIYLGERKSEDETMLAFLQAEVDTVREDVRTLLARILATEQFASVKAAKITWNELTLASLSQITRYVTAAHGIGAMSTQTARKHLRLDEKEESRLMTESHEHPERYTPPFEKSQGLLGKEPPPTPEGGRPPGT